MATKLYYLDDCNLLLSVSNANHSLIANRIGEKAEKITSKYFNNFPLFIN